METEKNVLFFEIGSSKVTNNSHTAHHDDCCNKLDKNELFSLQSSNKITKQVIGAFQ